MKLEKANILEQNQSHLSVAKCRQASRAIVNFFKALTIGLDNESKEKIFQGILHDPLMQRFSPQPHLAGVQDHPVLAGLRNSLQSLKKPRTSKEMFLKRATVLMVMNSSTTNIAAAAKALGTRRRNFYAAKSKLQQETLPLQLCDRQVRTKDAISDEVKELVVAFWTSNTWVSPNKKDVC